MKKEFKCYKCKKINTFDTDEVKMLVELTESKADKPKNNIIAYIVECKFCKIRNDVKYEEE